MNLVNLLAVLLLLLFAHCNAYQIPTLRQFGRRAVSSFISIHHQTPSRFTSGTRLTDRSAVSPSPSSWCLFSTVGSSVDDQGDKTPKRPSLDLSHNQTAFDYFNNSFFFDDWYWQDTFIQAFSRLNEDKKKILTMTLDEFFRTAFQREKADGGRALDRFFLTNMAFCNVDNVLEAYDEWKKIKGIGNLEIDVDNLPRMVNVDFQIKDSNLSHRYDLDCFSDRVDDLIRCHENPGERIKYVAPYFCFVQSSGMGKTKILYEYQQVSYKQKGVASFVAIGNETTSIFPKLDLANVGPRPKKNLEEMTELDMRTFRQSVASHIFDTLDKELEGLVTNHPHGNEVQKVALLFDESQYLLKEEFGQEAFRFRCIRRWLMEKPRKDNFRSERRLTVVAVFTGTSSKLTNVLFESDSDLAQPAPPSRFFVPDDRDYFSKGRMLHRPFIQTTTMGSCRDLINSTLMVSEYERAAYRGRPLLLKWLSKDSFMRVYPPFSSGCFVMSIGRMITGTGGSTYLRPACSWDKYLQMWQLTSWPKLMQTCVHTMRILGLSA